MSQLRLLGSRRFWPLFWTQFFGAFNDNLFKNALAIMVIYKAMSWLGFDAERLAVGAIGVFILPFFLFSATAGQLADRYRKSLMIRWIKCAEIVIMIAAGIGFATDNLPLLLAVLFCMGLQSAFFGPAKYSILPELLDGNELVGGNALVETGTFFAILLGTIVGGAFVGRGDAWIDRLGLVVVTVAALGFLASLFITRSTVHNPGLKLAFNPVTPTFEIVKVTARNRTVFLSILGLSWFWFIGASFISLLPAFSKDALKSSEEVVTLFLALFCVGIAVGSLACERLSNRRLELGLVPLGSIGISVFALDLAVAAGPFAAVVPDRALLGVVEFLGTSGCPRICLDLFLVAVFSGFYTVPLYTLIQQRSSEQERSRVIAGNNIMNALFIVVSSLLLMVFLAAGLTIPWIFAVLAVMNAAVALFIYSLIPEFLLRFAAWVLSKLMYRVRVKGAEHLPLEGPTLIVANHVSYIDWLLIASVSPRPPRFLLDHRVSAVPVLRFLFRDAKVIPTSPSNEELDQATLDRVAAELADGQVVVVFPEGRLTTDGELAPFRPEVEALARQCNASVVPLALVGLWGSFFSLRWGPAMSKPFRRFYSKVWVRVAAPIAAPNVRTHLLAETVAALGGWQVPAPFESAQTAEKSDYC